MGKKRFQHRQYWESAEQRDFADHCFQIKFSTNPAESGETFLDLARYYYGYDDLSEAEVNNLRNLIQKVAYALLKEGVVFGPIRWKKGKQADYYYGCATQRWQAEMIGKRYSRSSDAYARRFYFDKETKQGWEKALGYGSKYLLDGDYITEAASELFPPEPQMVCSACNNMTPQDSNYCKNCGVKLKD